MTSKVSTFPYPAKECTEFIDLLKTARDHPSDGNTTCLVGEWHVVGPVAKILTSRCTARLWSIIGKMLVLRVWTATYSSSSSSQI